MSNFYFGNDILQVLEKLLWGYGISVKLPNQEVYILEFIVASLHIHVLATNSKVNPCILDFLP